MKVLWFSNSPGNAIEYLEGSFVGSSWIPALDKIIQERVDLHIAFYYPRSKFSFKYGATTYHPIGTKNWKLLALFQIFRHINWTNQDLNRYLEIINLVKPDIIQIHGTENSFGCIIPYTKIPVVVSIQGYLTVIEHKFQNGFSKHNLRTKVSDYKFGIRKLLFNKSFIRIQRELRIRKMIELENLVATNYVIGRTAWDRRVTSILAPQSQYYHCDEILRSVFYSTIWKYSPRKKIIIHSTLGNTPYKGFETICAALHELKSIPDIQVEWQIAGIELDDSIIRITKNKLKERFPDSGIKYLGKVEGHSLSKMICSADIFVSPSHIENSSNSLCEAMMIGIPCVATFVGGTGSILDDGREGILIQDGDPWALAGAILEIYRDPEMGVNFGRLARARALMRHNPQKIVDTLIHIYNAILANQSTSDRDV